MDFQKDIVDPKGAIGGQGVSDEVDRVNAIPNTAQVLAAARSVGMTVVHIAVAFRPGHPEIGLGSPLFQSIPGIFKLGFELQIASNRTTSQNRYPHKLED